MSLAIAPATVTCSCPARPGRSTPAGTASASSSPIVTPAPAVATPRSRSSSMPLSCAVSTIEPVRELGGVAVTAAEAARRLIRADGRYAAAPRQRSECGAGVIGAAHAHPRRRLIFRRRRPSRRRARCSARGQRHRRPLCFVAPRSRGRAAHPRRRGARPDESITDVAPRGRSAGLLLLSRPRRSSRGDAGAHPGGPFWAQTGRTARGRSRKGGSSQRTGRMRAARRDASFVRSSASTPPEGPSIDLGMVRQAQRQARSRLGDQNSGSRRLRDHEQHVRARVATRQRRDGRFRRSITRRLVRPPDRAHEACPGSAAASSKTRCSPASTGPPDPVGAVHCRRRRRRDGLRTRAHGGTTAAGTTRRSRSSTGSPPRASSIRRLLAADP